MTPGADTMTRSVLFVCNMNAVRSPMAAALLRARAGEGRLVDSAGVYEGWLDPFVQAVMQEEEISLDDHEPKAMKKIDMSGFEVVIALTQEAAGEARRFVPAERIEIWDLPNPSDERGDREEVLAAYRAVRDALKTRIAERFDEIEGKP